MIIESAFMKLPEILENCDITEESEREVQNAIAMAILQELGIRNIKNPLNRIHVEKNYKKGTLKRCDLYVDFSGVYQHSLKEYNIFTNNWVELKHFKSDKGTPNKTENLASVVNDIYRLLSLSSSTDGKYILITCDEIISKYLTHTTYDNFVNDIFINKKLGIMEFDFTVKKKNFKEVLGLGEKDKFVIKFNIIRNVFFESTNGYNGYLIQIANTD